MMKLKARIFLISTILGLNFFTPTQTAKSFVPEIYKPNIEGLKKTGLEIGYTAAHLIKIGQEKEGIGLAKVALTLNPQEVELWIILAEGQIRTKRLNEAMNSINEAKKYNSKIAGLWFAEASIALNQNNPNLAISSLNSGLKIEPNNSRAYFQLGNAKIMKKHFKSSLKSFRKAFSIQKDFWQAINNEGLVLYELGKKQEAIKSWEKVLLINEDAEPKLALAAALNKLNPRNSKSIKLTKEALEQNPNYIHERFRKEQLWGKKLQAATKKLLTIQELDASINKAIRNSDFSNKL